MPGRFAGAIVVLAMLGCPTFPPPLGSANTLGDGGSADTGAASSTGASDGTEASSGSTDGGSTSNADGTGDPEATTGGPACASGSPGTVGACDPYAQDCPAGEKCLPWADDGGPSWNSTRCSPVSADPAQYGEPCVVAGSGTAGQDSCDVGLMCALVDEATLEGTCRELCKCGPNEGQCFEAPADCGIFNGGALPICLPHCDPLASICPPQEVCIPTRLSAHPVCATDASGDAGAPLDPCVYPTSCDAGSWCAPGAEVPGCASEACCTPVCDLDAPDCSAVPGTVCEPWYGPGEAPEPGLAHIGLCRAA